MKKLYPFLLAFATLCFIGFYGCKQAAKKAKEPEKEKVEVVDTIEKAVEETPADTVETPAEQKESDE